MPNSNFTLRLERIWVIAKTDYALRYYGTKLGLLWALINPIFQILVYYVCFTYLVFRNKEPDFILYLFLGIISWNFFGSGTKSGLGILFKKKYLLESTQINKFDFFISDIITQSLQFFISLLIYFVFSLIMGVNYSYLVLYFVPIFFSMIFFTMGVSMVLSVLKVYFHDINQIWDLIILVGFWSIPIIWDYKILYDTYPTLLYVNPFTGIVINMRKIFLYNELPDISLLIFDLGVSVLFLMFGTLLIRKFTKKIIELR